MNDDWEVNSAAASGNDERTVGRIWLHQNPTCLKVLDYSKLGIDEDLPVKRGGLLSLVIVGTKQGKVLVYKVDGKDQKALL